MATCFIPTASLAPTVRDSWHSVYLPKQFVHADQLLFISSAVLYLLEGWDYLSRKMVHVHTDAEWWLWPLMYMWIYHHQYRAIFLSLFKSMVLQYKNMILLIYYSYFVILSPQIPHLHSNNPCLRADLLCLCSNWTLALRCTVPCTDFPLRLQPFSSHSSCFCVLVKRLL